MMLENEAGTTSMLERRKGAKDWVGRTGWGGVKG